MKENSTTHENHKEETQLGTKIKNLFNNLQTRLTGKEDIINSSIKTKESEQYLPVNYEVFDENSPSNPYSNNPAIPYTQVEMKRNWLATPNPMSEVSLEGFHHNPEAHRHIGRMIAQNFNLKPSSNILEFGCGDNYEVAQGLLNSGCVNTTLLNSLHPDVNFPNINKSIPKDSGAKINDKIPFLAGDIFQAMDASSVLRNKAGTFDFIMANGAMFSGGYNFTVKDTGEARYHHQKRTDYTNYEEENRYANQYLYKVLGVVRKLLKDGGTFYFSSSRYANHGAGYADLQLHLEKIMFLNLLNELKKHGAKKITVFGLSPKSLKANIELNLGNPGDEQQLLKQVFKKLFVERLEPPMQIQVKKDGEWKNLTHAEFSQISNDPDKFNALLESPELYSFLEAEKMKLKTAIDQVYQSLTGKIEALPEILEFSRFDQQTIQETKAGMTDFPPEIARIDAVAVTF